MSFWKETGILTKAVSGKEYTEKAWLIEKAEDGLLLKEFKFTTVEDEAYQETATYIGESIVRSKTIETPYYWMPFYKGARVRFIDNQEMIVKSVIEVTDSKKAIGDGKGLVALRIIF